MKLKPININGYLVLVDESAEINDGDVFIAIDSSIQKKKPTWEELPSDKKIIFAEKELNLDVPILPNWRDFEQYNIGSSKRSILNKEGKGVALLSKEIQKYSQAVCDCLNNKAKYTEEDLKQAARYGQAGWDPNKVLNVINVQKVPKYIVMEDEEKCCGLLRDCIRGNDLQYVCRLCSARCNFQPKLNTNSEGIIKEIIW